VFHATVVDATVAQVPRHTLSLWNRYQFAPRVGAGLGVIYRSDMFAAIDNTVTLPGFVRANAAVFFSLIDASYYLNADSNTNISPGSPRAVRIGLTARF
jgi:catecholate siderophore receptor